MKKAIFLILFILPVAVLSQTEFETYNWDTFSSQENQDTIECVNGEAITLERRIFEIYLNQEKYFEEMFVFHRKIKIDSHDGLARNNKIYISLDNVIDIINIQARFISPYGKITNLPKESIKQIANMDNQGDYKTFAIEGAEIGGQIEYFYVLRKKFNPYLGYYIQDHSPKTNVDIIFVYPSKLEYLIKSYNGLPSFTINTENQEKTYQKTHINYIPAVEEEKYTNYKSNLMRFEFTLAYNRFNSSLRKYSWGVGSYNTYNNFYDLSKTDKSVALSLYKQIVTKNSSQEESIRAIENWIKSNINIKKEIPYQKNLNSVLKLKQANYSSALRLFVGVLLSGNINFEFIQTGENSKRPFDPDFNGINYMNNYLLYFPEIKMYLIPDDPEYRLGLIPQEYQGQYGLFMKPVSYNEDLNSLGYEIRKIPVQDYEINTDSLLIDLILDQNETNIHAKIHRSINGSLGQVFQNLFQNLTEDKKNEISENFFQMGSHRSNITQLSIKNDHPNNIGIHPIIWDLNLVSSSLIENAGNDLVFHIGETIGQQSELYQEHTRKLPISVGILHNYYRKIEFQIPQGYSVTNLENLNMNVAMKDSDKVSCTFTSVARIQDSRLVVISHEYYTKECYPASRYDEFRSVINAAADFNKKTILLKKL